MNLDNKTEIRKSILKNRKALTEEIKSEYDNKIFMSIINSEFYKKAKTIFVYVSFEGEVDTLRLINQALKDNKTIAVPKVISKEFGMKAFAIKSLNDLELGHFGVREPKIHAKPVKSQDIDLIIMPGLAFDKQGGRIGYGGGFYDKFISNLNTKPSLIGLAYSFQILDKVPTEAHDEKLHGIITEKENLKFF